MLGLPDHVRACLFDLDGVLTDTASVHRQAWKAMFDDYLRARSDDTGEEFVPFDAGADYEQYVDGKPHGKWTYWYESGAIHHEDEYVNGDMR